MPYENAEQLLRALLAATSPSRFREILQEIGDYADIGLDTPFPPFLFSL